MSVLTPGANAPAPAGPLNIKIHHGAIAGADIDVSAFAVTSSGKVRSDADMCFYGQPNILGGMVALLSSAGGATEFKAVPAEFPSGIEKIIFTATIHENKAAFGSLSTIRLDLGGVTGEIPCAGKTETALILAELYLRNGAWKLRVVGQGFDGGLAALATHLGVEIEAPAAPAPAPKPVSLKKVTLTKSGAKERISLDKKKSGIIRVTATWIDNGDNRDDNDDLDLRAGLLMPDGKVYWVAASHAGSLDAAPYMKHLGDVTSASADAPGTEIIEVNPKISHHLGGPVGMVFSVYSAISNGAVSIASLHPEMKVEYEGNEITCKYSFPDGNAAKGVYTYVIGTILVDGDNLDVQLSGKTSPKSSENTPWITRTGDGLEVSFDGTPVFKKGRNAWAKMLGSGAKKYENV